MFINCFDSLVSLECLGCLYLNAKLFRMDKTEKLHLMDKMIRELQDISNTQTSLLKKISQIEAENINLGNSLLDKKLPDIHSKVDDGVNELATLQADFKEARDKFVKDNNLGEALPE